MWVGSMYNHAILPIHACVAITAQLISTPTGATIIVNGVITFVCTR